LARHYAPFFRHSNNYSCLYQCSDGLQVKRVPSINMYTFFHVCMLLAVADNISRNRRVPRSSFVTFLVQAKELHQKGFQPCYQGPSSHTHYLSKHLPFLFSFCFLSAYISVSYVPSFFSELLCCPWCWRVQVSLVGGGAYITSRYLPTCHCSAVA
jgi:hypothetical protein